MYRPRKRASQLVVDHTWTFAEEKPMDGSFMRNRWLVSPPIVVACGLIVAAGAETLSAEDTAKAMDGNWRLVAVELAGEVMPPPEEVVWTIKEDKVLYAGEALAVLVNYPTAMPKGVDLRFDDPQRDYEGIYLLENDKLRICLNTRTTGPKERPSDFATKEKANLRVFIFERLAPGDQAGQT